MAIDPAALLDRLGLDGSAHHFEPLLHNRWLTPGIWRVHGAGTVMVLKYVAASRDAGSTEWEAHWTVGADDPHHWNHWAREGLAYRSRLLERFRDAGLDAPRLLASSLTDRDVVLLLEHVDGSPAEGWTVEQYAPAAHALGRAQAAPRGPTPHEEDRWLSRGFLRRYATEKPVDWSLLDDDAAWDQPLIRATFPDGLRSAARRLHHHREELHALVERLPRTLCHLDFWTKNLIRRPDGTTVALDWGFVGDGALGEDIGNLVPDAVFDHFVPADRMHALQATVLDAYTRGLVKGGWTGDPALARLGMLASAVKYDWLTPLTLAAAGAPRHLRYGGTEEIDPTFRFRERGLALLHNADNAHRALALASTLHV